MINKKLLQYSQNRVDKLNRVPSFQLALRFINSRRRAMLMSLAGIVFGISFFVITQAQISGFQEYFIKPFLVLMEQ